MSAHPFTLPVAWRDADGGTARATVPFDDLADALRALCGDAPPVAALFAAHLKVLGTLTGERVFRTDVMPTGDDGDLRRVDAAVSGPTWRDLVDRSWRAACAAAVSDDREPTDHDGVVFVAPTDTGRPANTDRQGPHGLRVLVGPERLLLRAAHGAVAPGYLDRLALTYRAVLKAMSGGFDDPHRAFLGADERRAVLAGWSVGPRVDRGRDGVVDLVRAQAARTPQAVAVRVGDACLTYRELESRSNQIGHHLAGLGAGQDAPVGVCLRRDADLLPALLGTWKAGAGYVPLDPDLPVERLRHMLGAAGCRLVVTTTDRLATMAPVDGCRPVLLDRDRSAVDAAPTTPPPTRTDPGHLAYVIYTSGSTGAPKGVMVQHGGLVNYLRWTVDAYASRGPGGSPFFASLSFDLGIPSLYTPLLTGQAVHLLPDPLQVADLGDLLVAGAPYSFVKLTPGQLNLLCLDLDPAQAHRLAGVVVAAGDAFPAALAERWRALAGPGGTAVATEYGPTEITIGNSGQPVIGPPTTELVPLGAPVPNTTMYVLTDRLEPAPVGVPGEIHVGGAGVARGYLAEPALTADRFRPDPFGTPGTRLYRTGDLGRWLPDGTLEFLGRIDHQVKIRGYRVELGEIRAVLRERPEVGDAVIVPTGPAARPRGLAAFVVPVAGHTVDVDRIRAQLTAHLPDYMIPAAFVVVGEIPLTANGKADTGALLGLLGHRPTTGGRP
ncbi:MAG: amino acid adenylation domain-containing protein [Saccharothrix sp.]|nr:amino acid adenylation domain-containing protein [Saccharothrix sp.]